MESPKELNVVFVRMGLTEQSLCASRASLQEYTLCALKL